MSSFADDLNAFTVKLEAQHAAIFSQVVDAVHDSIVNGSPVTAAPGQPVDTGDLKSSWIKSFDSPTSAEITTNVVYAPSIEDGVSYAHGEKPLTQHSPVGGFHSVALTVAGFDLLVADVARRTP
jgi:hypothetical protein